MPSSRRTRQHVGFEISLPERVFALQRRDRMLAVSAADVGDAGLGQAEVENLALAHQVADRAGDLLDRHGRIDAMLVEEVDPVGREAAQRSFDRRADRLRPAVSFDAEPAYVVEDEAELGGDRHELAPPFYRAADQRLVGERAVGLGGVEERAAEVDGAMQGRDRFRLVRRSIGLAHAHAAESNGRDFKPLLAEFPPAQGHRRAPSRGRLHWCAVQAKSSIS